MMSVEMQGGRTRLRVIEDTEQRGISVAECEALTGRWRKFHNEELQNCTLHQI